MSGDDSRVPRRFRVIAERDGSGWRARIEGLGVAAAVPARDLSDIEPRARRYIWGCTGLPPADIELDLEVRVPPALQLRLDLSDELRGDAADEVAAAVDDLVGGQFALSDVCRLLEGRWVGPRPLVVTNDEILRHGLARHPEAVGIRWDDHGRFTTVTCRGCVEATRASYLDLPPEGPNMLLYRGPIVCDRCHEEV